jgi:hypothetical protein
MFTALAALTRRLAAIAEETSSITEDRLAAALARIGVETDEQLGIVNQLDVGVATVLRERVEGDPSGRIFRLRITQREREDLLQAIDRAFGSRAREDPRTAPWLDSLASSLRTCLTRWATR